MDQIKIFNSEDETNEWLEGNRNRVDVVGIKLGAADEWDVILVHYKEI